MCGATQPVLSCPDLPCPILSYLILSYPDLSYHILPYPVLSYPILPYPILSYLALSYPILPYAILPCPALSRLLLFCLILSCNGLSYLILSPTLFFLIFPILTCSTLSFSILNILFCSTLRHPFYQSNRTGLFSATQTKELKELARAGLRNPVSVTVHVTKKIGLLPAVGSINSETEKKGKIVQQATPSSLENFYMICPYDERPLQLSLFIMKNLKSKIIVFCSTCACVDYYSEIYSKMTKMPTAPKREVTSVTGIAGDEGGKMDLTSSSSSSSNVKSSHLPSCISTLGFHGKMVPKKRALLYKKFLSLSSGVLFCTDIAARGIDFPDIDFIVQLSAPKGQWLC